MLGALIAVPVAHVLQILLRQYLEYTGRADMELPLMFDADGQPAIDTSKPAEA